MNIREMHYDFKKKLNKIDSQGNRNLLIPEIDWLLNEALTIFINNSASPRIPSYSGIEKTQRYTDDLYPLVVRDLPLEVEDLIVSLPKDYMFYISADVLMTKGKCSNKKGRLYIQQQDDEFEDDPFAKSSFEWREVNGVFTNRGIKLFTDDTFVIDKVNLTYMKRHPYICYPTGFKGGRYNLPGGVTLIEDVDCLLPSHTHSTIVDIAVAIASGELQTPDINIKSSKLTLNQFN